MVSAGRLTVPPVPPVRVFPFARKTRKMASTIGCKAMKPGSLGSDQDMLDSINRFYFCCFWINPVHHLTTIYICKSHLVRRT
jgi:hypothetical protein